MNKIPEVINKYNVYGGDKEEKFVGISGEITLPSFDMTTHTMTGAGILGEIENPVVRQFKSTDMEIPLFVLSNGDYMNGASVMLYKDPLRDFANYMGHDLYILPSSIHEVILLLDDEYVQSSEELREMVRETNRMVVDQEEVLSDHIYHYDREKDEIRIAK